MLRAPFFFKDIYLFNFISRMGSNTHTDAPVSSGSFTLYTDKTERQTDNKFSSNI